MAHIYICYSQSDAQFKDELVGALQAIYLDRHQFWHEKKTGVDGEVWPGVVEWVEQCDVFMYLLSNEAVTSKQCRAEFREAIRLGKRILAVQVRDQIKPSGKVGDLQYVDMRNSLEDRQAFERFLQVFNKMIEQLPKQKQKPDQMASKTTSQPEASVELDPSQEKRKNAPLNPRPLWKDPRLVGAFVGGVVLMLVGLMLGRQPAPVYEATPTQVAQLPPPTATLIIVPLNTVTPDIFEMAQIVLQQQTADANAATAMVVKMLNETQSAQETQAAALWTATPTPNITQTLNAIFTEWAQGTAVEQSYIATATAQAWTPTPTEPATLVVPQTIVAPAITVAPFILTEVSLLAPEEQIGFIPIDQNSDWAVVERSIEGAPMMLVPIGCFTMGSQDGDGDEQPMAAQCLERPFWIDKYEVTNRLFWSLGGEADVPSTSHDMDEPRDNVTWDEAQAFCIRRGGRLPSEREWEYAARGPSNLVYPWGNDWNQNNIVWIGSHTAEVGSRPRGSSWVGAFDIAGNISEWVSSLYRPYPYQLQDGREGSGNLNEPESHLYRGQGLSFMGEGDFRSANRIQADVPYSVGVGFRCLRPI